MKNDDPLGLQTLAAPATYAGDAVATPFGQLLLLLVGGALLLIAGLPVEALPDRRLAAAIAQHRVEFATAGLSVLLGVLAVIWLN